ncbi:MAG: hypothetical protein JXP73_21930 [Deltaproteobacteria bacterium]|nr:hypothetical protein [Deltaproteobacteria bacterium]
MSDVELGPEERALIAAAREAHVPSKMQRARVRKGLDAKLAAGVAVPLLASSTALAMAGKIGAGIALVAAVGAGTAYVVTARPAQRAPAAPTRHVAMPARIPTAMSVPKPPPAGATEALGPAATRPGATPPRTPVRRREASPAPPADLAGELALLTQASAATQRGDSARAERILHTYDQRFPSGQLAEERAAAGILVLCASGRTQSARDEARRFLERWPRSPLVARINNSCAAEDETP